MFYLEVHHKRPCLGNEGWSLSKPDESTPSLRLNFYQQLIRFDYLRSLPSLPEVTSLGLVPF